MIEFSLGREYYHQQDELRDWCTEHFGEMAPPSHGWWFRRFAFGTQFFSFVREEDASLFALYWL